MPRERRPGRLGRDTRATTAVEFGMIALPFLMLLLFVFELSYDLFSQAALDNALQIAARQLQTGNAQNVKDGNDFITKYLCPDLGGLLACSGVYIKVAKIAPTSTQDYYDYTTGTLPTSGGTLDLSSYAAASFCNAGPAQLLLVSAVYVGPAFLGGLLPGVLSVSYNGARVHASLATVGLVSESYTPAGGTGGAKPC